MLPSDILLLFEIMGVIALAMIFSMLILWTGVWLIGRMERPADPTKCHVTFVRGTAWCKTHQRSAYICRDEWEKESKE
jgi:hypothetical protein